MTIAAALLAALIAGPVADEAARILADDRFAFCHDERYPLTPPEARWCPPVGPEHNPRCPAFRRACDAPRAALDPLGRLGFSRRAGESPEDGPEEPKNTDDHKRADDPPAPPKPAPQEPPQRRDDLELPELGGVGRLLFWAIVVLGALLVAFLIFRNSVTRRREDAPVEPDGPTATTTPLVADAPPGPPVRDVQALLEQARAAASAGDFARAILRAHAALLHRLDHDGKIRVTPSRTNGDHLRDLASDPALRAQVGEVVRDVEQVQFGAQTPDAGTYERVVQRVVPIATRRADTLAVLLAAASLLSCDPPAGGLPFDLSPSGAQAVIELGAAHDRDIRFRTAPLADLVDATFPQRNPRTLVLLHDAAVDPALWPGLLAWATGSNHLVLAGLPPPPELNLSLVPGASGHVLKVSPDLTATFGPLELVTPDGAVLDPAGADATRRALLEYADGSLYAAQFHRDWQPDNITVLADDRLFTNGGLMLGDNPDLLIRLLADLGPTDVELVDALLGLGADSPVDAVQRARLTPIVLQIFALLALFWLWRGVHFGRPRDPPVGSRRRFAEHVQALGAQYFRGRATRHALRLYAAWALERLRDRTSSSRQPGLYALAQAIAARTGDDEHQVMQTLVEANTLRDDATVGTARPARHDPLAAADDLRLMQALARLVRLVGGPR